MTVANGVLNELAIRRLSKVLSTEGMKAEEPISKEKFVAFLSDLSDLGYWLNKEAFEVVADYSDDEVAAILEKLAAARGVTGFKSMYLNFPKQVVDMSYFELYFNAIVHYAGDMFGVRITPSQEVKRRNPLDEEVEVTLLGVASMQDLSDLASEIAAQGQPYSQQDKNDLSILADSRAIPKFGKISVKENLVFLVQLFKDVDFSESFTNVTDVLRLASGLSGGDISLSENTKFNLSRSNRRLVIDLFEKTYMKDVKNNAMELASYDEKWKRLFYCLHYKGNGRVFVHKNGHKFNPVKMVCDKSKSVKTYNSKVEKAILSGSIHGIVSTLVERPGVFARRLAELLRKFPDKRVVILESFAKVSDKVSVRVLVQLWNHFNGPTADKVERTVFMIKSQGQKSGVKDNLLVGDQSDVIAVIEHGLRNRVKGKVFVKPYENSYAVPMGVRSASSGLNIVGRGSRIKVSDQKGTVRLFMHWKDQDGSDSYYNRVDLDLSVFLIDKDFTRSETVSYYNLNNKAAEIYHSGDLTSAPNGAAEFIDINVEKSLKAGWRYVLLSVFSYTGQTFDTIPEASAGVMLRSKPNSGEIFEPKTVASKFDLNSASRNSSPVVFDLETRELIWWDSTISTTGNMLYNVANNENRLTIAMKSLVHSKFMTVEKLAELIAEEIVSNEEDADVVIDPASTSSSLSLLM